MPDPEKIKARLAQKGIGGVAVQELPAPPPPPSAAAAPSGKTAPPIVRYEDVPASCGHLEKFGHFDDKIDRFRKDRRKKITDRPCKACRERKRLEEEAAAKVRPAAKHHQAQQGTAGAPASRKPLGWITERLPDGAKFEVTYDAAQTRLTGTLTIGEKVFTDSAGAVFKLLRKLDRQYRESVPASKA